MKKFVYITAAMLLAFVSCRKEPSIIVPQNVTFDVSGVVEITKGTSYKLNVTVDPENAEFDNLIWESLNPDVIAVDGEGNVTGVGLGTGKIKVTVTLESQGIKVSAECTFSVESQYQAPSFTAQPKSITVKAGESYSVSAEASCEGLEECKWEAKYGADAEWETVSQTDAIHNVEAAAPTDIASETVYSYRCTVSNEAGSATSEVATVTIQAFAAPEITTQPTDQAIGLGQSATISIAASSEGTARYIWQIFDTVKNEWVEYSAGSSPSLTVGPYENEGDYRFRCIVTNESGNTSTSNEIVVTVFGLPRITVQPVGSEATAGTPMTVEVTVDCLVHVDYQWEYRSGDNWKLSNDEGSKTAKCTTTPPKALPARTVLVMRCKISNALGSVYSEEVELVANPIPAPVLTTQPAGTVIGSAGNSNTSCELSVAATCDEPMTYQWCENGSIMTGETSPTLTVKDKTEETYTYYCVVKNKTNGLSTKSENAEVRVIDPPTIASQPTPETLTKYVGSKSAAFTVQVATGTAQLESDFTYQWQKRIAVTGSGGRPLYLYDDPASNATANGNVLTFTDLVADNAGSYRVIISNVAGSATSGLCSLTVSSELPPAPEITTQPPTAVTVTSTSPVTIGVRARGEGTLTYDWQRYVSSGNWVSSTDRDFHHFNLTIT